MPQEPRQQKKRRSPSWSKSRNTASQQAASINLPSMPSPSSLERKRRSTCSTENRCKQVLRKHPPRRHPRTSMQRSADSRRSVSPARQSPILTDHRIAHCRMTFCRMTSRAITPRPEESQDAAIEPDALPACFHADFHCSSFRFNRKKQLCYSCHQVLYPKLKKVYCSCSKRCIITAALMKETLQRVSAKIRILFFGGGRIFHLCRNAFRGGEHSPPDFFLGTPKRYAASDSAAHGS